MEPDKHDSPKHRQPKAGQPSFPLSVTQNDSEERRRDRALVSSMCLETVRSYIAERLIQALTEANGLRMCYNEAFTFGSTSLMRDFSERLVQGEKIMRLLLAIGSEQDWERELGEVGVVQPDDVLDIPCRYYQSIVNEQWIRTDLINKGMTPQEADEEMAQRSNGDDL